MKKVKAISYTCVICSGNGFTKNLDVKKNKVKLCPCCVCGGTGVMVIGESTVIARNANSIKKQLLKAKRR